MSRLSCHSSLRIAFVIGGAYLLFAGCSQTELPDVYDPPLDSRLGSDKEDDFYEDPPFEEIDQDLLRAVLANCDYSLGDNDRIYFLTTTPLAKWIQTGEFRVLPDTFHESLSAVGHRYRSASDAYVQDEAVFEKGTDREAWMVWVTIKRRAVGHLVIVECGVWRCQLGGAASVDVYQKSNGVWKRTKTLEDWVS